MATFREVLTEGLSGGSSGDTERRTRAQNRLADMVVKKELALNTLVDALGPQLTADDDAERVRGTELLAQTVSRALGSHRDALDATTQRVLAAFFAERLDDLAAQPAVLLALSALAAAASPFGACFGDANDCAALAAGLVTRIAPSALTPGARRQAVDIAAIAVARAQPSGTAAASLARGLRRLYVGDRDPRVLLPALGLTARLCRAAVFDETATKELFDAFSCYFPILFVPRQPEDAEPSTPVTRDELVAALRLCFAANSAFAPLSLPFLLDKTASSIAAARADAMLTLAACVRAYGGPAGCGADFPDRVLSALRSNSLTAGDSEAVVSAAVTLATTVTDAFAHETFVSLLVNDPLLKTLCAEGDGAQLVDVDDALAAKRMLPALLVTPAGLSVAEKAVAELAKHCRGATDAHTRALGTIADFAEAVSHSEGVPAAAMSAVCNACSAVLTCAESTTLAITEASRGIGAVAHSREEAMSDDNEAFIAGIRAMAHIAADSSLTVATESRAAATLGLANVGSHRPHLINTHALPTLLVASFMPSPTRNALRSLPPLCAAHPDLFNAISTAILSALDTTTSSGGAVIDTTLISTLADCCRDSTALTADQDVAVLNELRLGTALRIASVAIAATSQKEEIVAVCRAVVRSVAEGLRAHPDQQLALVRMLRPLFFAPTAEDEGEATPTAMCTASVEALPLFCSAVAACNAEVAPELVPDITPLLQQAATSPAAAMAVASILHKLPSESALVASAADEALAQGGASQPVVLAWLARALLLRGHPRAQTLLLNLIALCETRVDAAELVHVAVGRLPVDAEGGLGNSADDDKFTTLAFDVAFGPLLAMHEHNPAGAAPLVALAHVVEAAPRSVLEREAVRCVPAALRALLQASRDTATAAVAMICALATVAPALLGGDMLGSVIQRLCIVAGSASTSSDTSPFPAKARNASLAALLALRRTLPEYRTLPIQHVVVAALLPALDDPKRAVRAAAVRCRNAWIVFPSS